jgi:long-subunit acyl-CoA synthetase (AMP-forming)
MEAGYVTLIDRKKELIINAAGKNMSPANIEATLKGASPLIGQACVIGDGRRYNTALLGDELTPTMKLKRRPVEAKYATQIEAMY